MSKHKNIMVIANPESGKSDSQSQEDNLKEKLSQYFENVDIRFTEEAGHATELAKEACKENYHSVCSVGGDGTLAEVLTGLIECDNPPKLLIFPAGTGNIMSQNLGYTQNKNRVIDSIDYSKTKKVDVGRANNKIFSFLLSMGSIPESVSEVSNEEKEKFGLLAYASNVLKNINSEKDYELSIDIDGKNVYRGVVDHLGVSTSDKYGPIKFSGFNSSLDDGLLNLFVLKDSSLLTKAKFGFESIFGELKNDHTIEFYQGKEITISSLDHRKIHVDLDGDKGPCLPIKIDIIPNKIEVYLPKEKKTLI